LKRLLAANICPVASNQTEQSLYARSMFLIEVGYSAYTSSEVILTLPL
jgi:hypothetical protein